MRTQIDLRTKTFKTVEERLMRRLRRAKATLEDLKARPQSEFSEAKWAPMTGPCTIAFQAYREARDAAWAITAVRGAEAVGEFETKWGDPC